MSTIASDIASGKIVVGRKAFIGLAENRYSERSKTCGTQVEIVSVQINDSSIRLVVSPVSGFGSITVGIGDLIERPTKQEMDKLAAAKRADEIAGTIRGCTTTERKGKVLRLFDSLPEKKRQFITKELYEGGHITECDESLIKKLRGVFVVEKVGPLVVKIAAGQSLCEV